MMYKKFKKKVTSGEFLRAEGKALIFFFCFIFILFVFLGTFLSFWLGIRSQHKRYLPYLEYIFANYSWTRAFLRVIVPFIIHIDHIVVRFADQVETWAYWKSLLKGWQDDLESLVADLTDDDMDALREELRMFFFFVMIQFVLYALLPFIDLFKIYFYYVFYIRFQNFVSDTLLFYGLNKTSFAAITLSSFIYFLLLYIHKLLLGFINTYVDKLKFLNKIKFPALLVLVSFILLITAKVVLLCMLGLLMTKKYFPIALVIIALVILFLIEIIIFKLN